MLILSKLHEKIPSRSGDIKNVRKKFLAGKGGYGGGNAFFNIFIHYYAF